LRITALKALYKRHAKPGLWLEDAPKPYVTPNDVLIRVLKTAICGTDLHIYNWDTWAQNSIQVPMIIGHEFVGKVVETGMNVKDFHPGEIVSGEGHVVCGHCRNCLAGRRHLCANTEGIGVNRQGAFAEYVAIPETNVWHHEKGIDLNIAALFDALGNATHTALSFDVLGEDILITGAGPIGCMAAAICRHAGARYVVVTDINPGRLELALEMGATRSVMAGNEEISTIQKELNMKEGFDIGLEMSGSPQAFKDMINNMCHGGKIAMLGIPKEDIAIDWNTVIFNMLTIKGIYGREMYETWYKMTVMLQSGLDISPVITHQFSASEYEKGFAVMNAGESSKVILDWREF